MKRFISLILCLSLLAFGFVNLQFTSYAQAADAVTTATTWVEEKPVPVIVPVQKPTTVSPAPTPTTNDVTYTVMPGDVLWRVGQKNNISLVKLLSLNPQIKNPNLIYVGQKIVVSEAKVVEEIVKPTLPKEAVNYPNGIYRGVYFDSGIQQVGVQFSLVDNVVTAATYRTLVYKAVDYRAEKVNPLILATTEQYNALIQYMVGKNISIVLQEMYTPGNIVSDKVVATDTITGATVRSAKVISAVYDGLNRGLYSKGSPSVSYENGTYRGAFSDGGYQQVGVQFSIENNVVTSISYRTLNYDSVDYRSEKENAKIIALNGQYTELIEYLKGKDLRVALDDLYSPQHMVANQTIGTDTLTGATVRSAKVISSIKDGLNRGVYTYGPNATPNLSIATKSFDNGTYRGSFIDGGEQQVGIQISLENNIVKSISFRTLVYKEIDYMGEAVDKRIMALNNQYNALIQSLVGRDIRENLVSLYMPGTIVENQVIDTDTITGATIRSNKVISAIIDALNRNAYSK